MRTAYICADPGIPVFGSKGSSIHVQEVIRSLVRLGAEVDLFATRLDGEVPADLAAVRRHWLPALPKGDLALREQASLGANNSLWSALWREGPFDLVYERYSLWSFAGMGYAQLQQVPRVLEVNAPLIEEQARHRGLVDHAKAEEIATRVFTAASTIVAVSDQVARYVEGYPGACGRVHVVPNGVNPERFPRGVQPSLPASPGVFTIGFVGTLKPWHGLDVLAEAFTLLKRAEGAVRLLIVGDGPERGELERQLAAEGLDAAVHFTGAVRAAEIPGLLASMDVGVAPYPPREDFYFSPLKVFEYMAAGLPVVASGIGQISELIEHGRNGLLCAPGDPIALASALSALRADPLLRARLGTAARRGILRDHTWDAAVTRILEIAGLSLPAARVLAAGER